MVLFKQMQKELIELQKRRTQAQMDNILRQRRERKSINRKQQFHLFSPYQSFFYYILHEERICLILIHVTLRKNCFINTYDIPVRVKQMSKRKKTVKPKKIDLLELSASKKTLILKEAKEKLRQQISESKFWQSFAKTERVTINGHTITFENSNLPSSSLATA